jgi:hypothetical protein
MRGRMDGWMDGMDGMDGGIVCCWSGSINSS